MTKDSAMITGHLETDIGRLIHDDANLLGRYHSVLLTTLDSQWDLAQSPICGRIIEAVPDSEQLGSGIVIPGSSLQGVAEDLGLFVGFDELWCFEAVPRLPKPEDLSIVPPIVPGRAELARLSAWFEASGCVLGVGDGVGLNYVTCDAALARALERAAPEEGTPP